MDFRSPTPSRNPGTHLNAQTIVQTQSFLFSKSMKYMVGRLIKNQIPGNLEDFQHFSTYKIRFASEKLGHKGARM
jgi:hypothetical protein